MRKLKNKTKILVIDDEASICEVLSASLQDESYIVHTFGDGESGLKAIGELRPDIVFLDIWMPGGMDGLEVLRRGKSLTSSQFIIMSGHGTIETAVKAIKMGAWDFLEKPLSMDKAFILIDNIMKYREEVYEKETLLSGLRQSIAMIGESEVMVRLKRMVSRVSSTASWVIIDGEPGTGKELAAQNIHYLSSRAGRAFVSLNCKSIPDDLMESELFGYERGAALAQLSQASSSRVKDPLEFSPRVRSLDEGLIAPARNISSLENGVVPFGMKVYESGKLDVGEGSKGKFEYAQGGTLFLDEIDGLSLEMQDRILGVLKENKIQRVGGAESVEVDVRLIGATSQDLKKEVVEGRFREDLYYRLTTFPLHVPSLRERRGDILSLVSHFGEPLAREKGGVKKVFSEASIETLQNYDWHGNVRELKNVVEKIYILTNGKHIDHEDLNFVIGKFWGHGEGVMSFREARSMFEKAFLKEQLLVNNCNVSKTADLIGLERSYLHRKMKIYNIEV